MFYVSAVGISSEASKRGSIITGDEFQRKVLNKMTFIRSIVDTGFTVLFMDCDILLFQNPWPVLSQYTARNADMVAQKDYTLNSGFMLLFPTSATTTLLRFAYYHMVRRRERDQEAIQFAMRFQPSYRLKLLPESSFSNGRVFFAHHQFYWDAIRKDEVMMHNNFIIGSENKIYRLREMKLYNEDTDEYYSSPTRKYLMADVEEKRRNSTLYLMQVAVLCRILNRTFLLPTFLCPSHFSVTKCNLCRGELMCFKKFRNTIQNDYRSYVPLPFRGED